MHFVNQFLETRFGFRRRLEREQQMIESQAVGDRAAIVLAWSAAAVVFPASVTSLGLVNRAGDDGPSGARMLYFFKHLSCQISRRRTVSTNVLSAQTSAFGRVKFA
jgi:hypothetical protein